jgi:hypothetical protein
MLEMASNYTILSQSQSTEINPTGTGFMNVWEITYKVTDGPSKGTTATVTVPEEDHNASDVSKAIEAKIQALDEIANLGTK